MYLFWEQCIRCGRGEGLIRDCTAEIHEYICFILLTNIEKTISIVNYIFLFKQINNLNKHYFHMCKIGFMGIQY